MTRQACPKVEQVRSRVAPELRREFDNAVAGQNAYQTIRVNPKLPF